MFMYLRKYLVFVFLLLAAFANAQDKLIAAGATGDLHIVHQLKGKETLSVLSRIYGATPRQIAVYNNINVSSVLTPGTKLKIPLSEENLVQEQEFATSEPVFHIAGNGENLFRLSQRYFKVPLAKLREWNDLKTDVLKKGQVIVIGFIGGAKLAAMKADAPAATAQVFVKPPVIGAPVEPQPLKDPNVMDASVDGTREMKKGEMKPMTETDKFFAKAAADKAKKEAEVAANIVPPPVPVEQFKETNKVSPTEYKISEEELRYIPKQGDEGYFGLIYTMDEPSKTKVNKAGEAGIFKSLSGFSDRKFYALMNDVLPGTIVRISTADNKSVCARVLGPVPEIKGAPSLVIRLSNATAAALGKSENYFPVTITYLQ